MLRKRVKIYGIGDRVYIRSIMADDRKVFDRATLEREPDLSLVWPEYYEGEWKRAAIQHFARLVCTISLNDTGEVIGFCELRNLNTYYPYIGIQLLSEYTGKGYGGESITLLLRHIVKVKKDIRYFVWIADEDNYPSNRCIRRLGGRCFTRHPKNGDPFWEMEVAFGLIKESDLKFWNKYGLLPDTFQD